MWLWADCLSTKIVFFWCKKNKHVWLWLLCVCGPVFKSKQFQINELWLESSMIGCLIYRQYSFPTFDFIGKSIVNLKKRNIKYILLQKKGLFHQCNVHQWRTDVLLTQIHWLNLFHAWWDTGSAPFAEKRSRMKPKPKEKQMLLNLCITTKTLSSGPSHRHSFSVWMKYLSSGLAVC